MKRKIIIAVILVVVGAAIYFFIQNNRQRSAAEALANIQTVAITHDNITAIVGATGTVRANQTSTIGWQTSGRIESIPVKEGDEVKPFQELAVLANDSLSQAIILAHADMVNSERTLDDLQTSDTQQSQAYQQWIAAQNELEEALEDRESLDYQRSSQATIDEARANYLLSQNKVDDAEETFDAVSHLLETDEAHAYALSNLAAARRERDRLLANLNWLLSKPDTLEISEADARVEVAQASLEDAKREWERLKDGPDPEDIEAAQARVAANEAILKMATLEAPFGGTITKTYSKVGDMVSAGTVSFRIDDLSQLLVDVEIPEVDIPRIAVGQTAELTFDAIPEHTYQGTVKEVSRVGVETQGVVNFAVTIEISNPDEQVLPGMTAAVNIVITQIDNVLTVPNRAVRRSDGKQIVYILKDNIQTPVEIEIGFTSDINSEVVGGDLKEGDLVILNPSTFPFGGMGPNPNGH